MLYAMIDGLDIRAKINQFADEETYLQILRTYVITTKPLLHAIKEVSRETLSDYAVTVHGIKGSSYGIGAERLARMAEELEQAAKAADLDFVLARNAPFIDAARRLLSQTQEALLKIYPENPKPPKDKPDKDTLDQLLRACQNFDADAAEALIKELGSYEYQSGNELIASLTQNMYQFRLRDITEKLSAMAESGVAENV